MTENKRVPKKGAGRKWAARLKELAQKDPPSELVKKINEKEEDKKVARPKERTVESDL